MVLVPTNKHVHINTCRVPTMASSSSPYESGTSIDSTIYRTLSMRSNMKVITMPDRVKNEWELFLVTGSKKHNNEIYNHAFDTLDEYLGSLGVANGIC